MDLIRVKLGARNSGLHNSGECDQNKDNWTPGSQMTSYGSFWVGFKNLILNENNRLWIFWSKIHKNKIAPERHQNYWSIQMT